MAREASGATGASLLSLTRSSDPRTAGCPGHGGGLPKLRFLPPPAGTRDPGCCCLCQPRDGQLVPRTQQVSSSPRGRTLGRGRPGLLSPGHLSPLSIYNVISPHLPSYTPFRVGLPLAPNAALLTTNPVTNPQRRGAKSALTPRYQENPPLS